MALSGTYTLGDTEKQSHFSCLEGSCKGHKGY